MKKLLFAALLLLAAFLGAQNLPLNLIAPNGGEIWEIGSTQNILWTQQNLSGSVRLMLLGANSTVGTVIAQSIPVTQGSFAWTIPSTVVPGNYYKVGIYLASPAGTTLGDTSDGFFSIVSTNPPPPPPPQQGITVLSPNGGEVWNQGSTYPISWTSVGLEGLVRISLVQANGVQEIQIATNVPIESGVFYWTIPATIPTGTGFKVHVVWLSNLTVYFGDLSDGVFTIANPTPPPPVPLSIIAPNGGEVWQAGTHQTILWTAPNMVGNIDLMLFNGMNTNAGMPIAMGIPVGAGVFNWNIPANLIASDNYYVRISSADPATGVFATDYSDAPFTITAGTNPSLIQVVSPNGGEVWTKGNTYPITWTDSDPTGTVNIWLVRLRQNNRWRHIIAANVPNTGSYDWTIPLRLLPGNGYYVLIRKMNSTGGDHSDAPFTILGQITGLGVTPNPSKGETKVFLEMNTPTTPEISIYNLKGQLVRTLSSGKTFDGTTEITWDGRDSKGLPAGNGIYFVRAVNGTEVLTKRLIVIK